MTKTTEEILRKPEADLVLNEIINRKKRGLYTMIFAAGLPGSGKTSTCFRLGELISTAFEGKNTMKSENILDSFLGLTKFIIDAKPENLCIAVMEEVSVLFPSRRAMSGVNVDLARLLDTARKKQVILLANAPIWTSIDSHMRSLGNIYIETKKIYKVAAIVVSKFFRLQTNPRTGKTYTHSFHRGGKDVKRMYTKMPDTEEWEKYEKRKDDFMHRLYKRIKVRERKRIEKENKEMGDLDGDAGLTEQQLKIYNMIEIKKMKQVEVAKVMGCSPQAISSEVHKIRQKLRKNMEME